MSEANTPDPPPESLGLTGLGLTGLISGTRARLSQILPGLIGFEVLFRVLLGFVLLPLVAWSIQRLVAVSGSVAVSNFEMAGFLLSLPGLAVMLIGATTALGFSLAEQAGIYFLLRQSNSGWKCGLAALRFVAVRLPRLLAVASHQLGGYVIRAVPFLIVAGIVYKLLLTDANINYYMSEQPWQWWTALACGACLGLGYAVWATRLFVKWAFAVPMVLFEDAEPRTALSDSEKRIGQSTGRYWLWMVTWVLLSVALSVVVLAAAHWLSELILLSVGNRISVAILAVGGVLLMNAVTTAALSVIGLTVPSIVVYRLYAAENPELSTEQAAGQSEFRLPSLAIIQIGCLIAIAGALLLSWWFIGQLGEPAETFITAHRGSSAIAPENSMAAIKLAIDENADFCEIDVQETSDGVIVVLHDDDLMRIAGDPRKIWEIDLEELKKLDTGSWFDPKFSDERIPTLEEVIEVCRGRIRLNVELKFNKHDERLVERTVEILQQQDFIDQCVVTSLDLTGLLAAKAIEPQLTVGHIVTAAVGDVSKLEVDFLSLNMEQVNRSMMGRCRAAGKDVHVWTVNDVQSASRLADLGIDNAITDHPVMIRQFFEERAELSDVERGLLAARNLILD